MEDILVDAALDIIDNFDDIVDGIFGCDLMFDDSLDVNIIPEDTILAWMLLGLI